MTSQFTIQLTDWSSAREAVMPLRMEVFVVEQKVPPELELDEHDPVCVHAVARDAAGVIVGTGRLLPDGHIGRMAVARQARGGGIGGMVLEALVAEAGRRGHQRVVLSSQTHAVPFYVRHGFSAYGPTYMDAGIPHIDMARKLGG